MRKYIHFDELIDIAMFKGMCCFWSLLLFSVVLSLISETVDRFLSNYNFFALCLGIFIFSIFVFPFLYIFYDGLKTYLTYEGKRDSFVRSFKKFLKNLKRSW